MTDEELIARLRDAPADGLGTENLCIAAADRIEALVKERDGLLTTWAESRNRHLAAEARAEQLAATNERLEAALRGLMMHEPDHPDTLWQEAHAALKGEDHE
jgi:hypothetical protein